MLTVDMLDWWGSVLLFCFSKTTIMKIHYFYGKTKIIFLKNKNLPHEI